MRLLFLVILFSSCLANAAATVATFSVGAPQFTPASNATDLCTIYGSATKTVKVTSFEVASNQTTAGANQFYFVKRSTADSSGTAVSLVPIPYDSGKPAATATAQYYTANPTLGTSAGDAIVKRFVTGASTSLLIPYFDFLIPVNTVYQPVTLRGVAQGLALNFRGVAIPSGMTIGCSIKWTEE